MKVSLLKFRKPDYGPKVFCIGFNKTGTTSVGKALGILGFKHSSFVTNTWEAYRNGNMEEVFKFTALFESFDDLPWLLIDVIPQIDQKFPGSKFIYLEREEEDWMRSFESWSNKMGRDPGDMQVRLNAFRQHREFVMDYFKDRMEKDLLVLNVKDPGAFERMASFLGKIAPQPDFPHLNKTAEFKAKN